MELDPAALAPAERYKLLIGSIVPRPIAIVSTQSRDGRLNLAPFSFFNGVGSDPMSLLFCPANKSDGSMKDTLRNVLPPERGGIGEFVVNIATESLAPRMAAAAEPLPYGESEFDLAGELADENCRGSQDRPQHRLGSDERQHLPDEGCDLGARRGRFWATWRPQCRPTRSCAAKAAPSCWRASREARSGAVTPSWAPTPWPWSA